MWTSLRHRVHHLPLRGSIQRRKPLPPAVLQTTHPIPVRPDPLPSVGPDNIPREVAGIQHPSAGVLRPSAVQPVPRRSNDLERLPATEIVLVHLQDHDVLTVQTRTRGGQAAFLCRFRRRRDGSRFGAWESRGVGAVSWLSGHDRAQSRMLPHDVFVQGDGRFSTSSPVSLKKTFFPSRSNFAISAKPRGRLAHVHNGTRLA